MEGFRDPRVAIGANPQGKRRRTIAVVPKDAETVLELAERHVALGQSLVAKQKAIIERLRLAAGGGGPVSVADAESLLATLEETLLLMREHLAHELLAAAALNANLRLMETHSNRGHSTLSGPTAYRKNLVHIARLLHPRRAV